jgi:hypothetical protein
LVNTNQHSPSTQPHSVTFLTPTQLQEELQIGQKLCCKLLKEGRIPSTHVGNLICIYRPALERARLEDPELGEEKGGNPARTSRPQHVPPVKEAHNAIVHR